MKADGPVIPGEEVTGEVRPASSLPILIRGRDSRTYPVKCAGAGHGILESAVENMTSRFAMAAGIRVPPPCFLGIDASLAAKAAAGNLDPEITELLARSLGTNLGSLCLENGRDYQDKWSPRIGFIAATAPRRCRSRAWCREKWFRKIPFWRKSKDIPFNARKWMRMIPSALSRVWVCAWTAS